MLTVGSVPYASSTESGIMTSITGKPESVAPLSDSNVTYKIAGDCARCPTLPNKPFFGLSGTPYAGIPPGPGTETLAFSVIGAGVDDAADFGNVAVTLKSPGAGIVCALPSPVT